MVKAGMNFARLNFAHGTHESNGALLNTIRLVERETGEPIAILVDLQGPRIRVGAVPEEGVAINIGDQLVFNTAATEYKGREIPLDYSGLHEYLKPNERILIDDGRVEVEVESVQGTMVTTRVKEGTLIKAHKGINLPDSTLAMPVLSDKDREDIKFAVKNKVDFIGMSFVSNAKDILDVRYLIKECVESFVGTGRDLSLQQPIGIIAKIERHEAVKNLAEIIEVADSIMVARGDLGLELPKEEVPLIQKKIIDLANAKAKPVLVATQLLDSMRENSRPTRAEVSDVANAVIDHADGLVLTNETAAGKFPVETVETMAEIIVATEKSKYDDTKISVQTQKEESVQHAVTDLSRLLAEEVGAKLILAASLSGETGRLISHVRPPLPILVATSAEIVWRQLNISWGIKPFILPPCNSIEELVDRSLNYIKQHKIAKAGDKMIIVAGEPVGQAGNVNLVEVREIK